MPSLTSPVQNQPLSTYNAHWEPHFAPKQKTLIEKIKTFVWNLFSLLPFIGLPRLINYSLTRLAFRVILPAASLDKKFVAKQKEGFENRWYGEIPKDKRFIATLRKHYTPKPYQVKTPDGALLSATFFKNTSANNDTPTLLFFQPNGTTYYSDIYCRFLLDAAIQKKSVNFAFFDYRGVGDSKGTAYKTKDLLVDGASIFQWLTKQLQIPENKIFFYGRSLGGAIAVETAALAPEKFIGPLVNERSLSRIEDMIDVYNLPNFLKTFIRNNDLALNPADSLEKLTGEKLVAFEPQDPVIPYSASLYWHTRDKASYQAVRLLSLEPKIDAHNSPLESCQDVSSGKSGQKVISNFLFNERSAV